MDRPNSLAVTACCHVNDTVKLPAEHISCLSILTSIHTAQILRHIYLQHAPAGTATEEAFLGHFGKLEPCLVEGPFRVTILKKPIRRGLQALWTPFRHVVGKQVHS